MYTYIMDGRVEVCVGYQATMHMRGVCGCGGELGNYACMRGVYRCGGELGNYACTRGVCRCGGEQGNYACMRGVWRCVGELGNYACVGVWRDGETGAVVGLVAGRQKLVGMEEEASHWCVDNRQAG